MSLKGHRCWKLFKIGSWGYLFIFVAAGWFGINWSRLPEQLPWFYSLPWGDEQLVDKRVFGLGLLVLGVVFSLNLAIASWVGKEDEWAGKVVVGGGLLVIMVYLMSFYQVMKLILGL